MLGTFFTIDTPEFYIDTLHITWQIIWLLREFWLPSLAILVILRILEIVFGKKLLPFSPIIVKITELIFCVVEVFILKIQNKTTFKIK